MTKFLYVVAGLLSLATIVLGIIAIWTVGDDAGRFGATALLIGSVAFVIAMTVPFVRMAEEERESIKRYRGRY